MNYISDEKIKSMVYRGYINRFKDNRLFDIDSSVPIEIIEMYLNSNIKSKVSERIYKNFKSKYILCENELEGVKVSTEEVRSILKNNPQIHTKEEVFGLADVYEYINNYSFENISNFNIYVLLKIHSILYSHTAFPEYAGKFRESSARILESNIELTEPNMISKEISILYNEFNDILKKKDDIEEYIRSAINLHCKLIKIHPFFDGNGRSTRALNNLLIAYIGLPPTYVKLEEKQKYCEGLQDAILRNSTKKIEQFFLFKIANAIIENDDEFSNEALSIL